MSELIKCGCECTEEHHLVSVTCSLTVYLWSPLVDVEPSLVDVDPSLNYLDVWLVSVTCSVTVYLWSPLVEVEPPPLPTPVDITDVLLIEAAVGGVRAAAVVTSLIEGSVLQPTE